MVVLTLRFDNRFVGDAKPGPISDGLNVFNYAKFGGKMCSGTAERCRSSGSSECDK